MDHNPAVTLQDEPQWLNPVQLGTGTLHKRALDPATLASVRDVLDRLVGDPFIDFMRRYYALGQERFGSAWGFLDQLTVLHAAASLARPRRYLEIGVFRGRSLAVVASAAPEAELYGFDMWVQGYAGLENVGPDLVREQLRRVGHRGRVELVSGSSHETVPAFLATHPDLSFDLVTVDGDHTEAGARRDLETVLPRVAVGGVLVFDDLRHPKCPWLERVWDEVVGGHSAFLAAKYTEVGWGVGFAVRRAEARPEIETLTGGGGERLRRLAELLDEERAARDERLEACEADRARRLEIIQQQGDELGHVTAARNAAQAERDGLRAECADLQARLEASEADRAARLEVIHRQGDELGHVTAERNAALVEGETLRTAVDDLRTRLEASEVDRAVRLEVIHRQGDELGHVTAERNDLRAERDALRAEVEWQHGLLAHVAQSLDGLRALAGETLAGLLGPRKVKRLAGQLEALVATLASWRASRAA